MAKNEAHKKDCLNLPRPPAVGRPPIAGLSFTLVSPSSGSDAGDKRRNKLSAEARRLVLAWRSIVLAVLQDRRGLTVRSSSRSTSAAGARRLETDRFVHLVCTERSSRKFVL